MASLSGTLAFQDRSLRDISHISGLRLGQFLALRNSRVFHWQKSPKGSE